MFAFNYIFEIILTKSFDQLCISIVHFLIIATHHSTPLQLFISTITIFDYIWSIKSQKIVDSLSTDFFKCLLCLSICRSCLEGISSGADTAFTWIQRSDKKIVIFQGQGHYNLVRPFLVIS